MTIEEIQRIGAVCGLYTLGECYRNITIHNSMFSYKEFPSMLEKLNEEILALENPEWERIKTSSLIIDDENRKMQEYFEAEANCDYGKDQPVPASDIFASDFDVKEEK